MPDPHVLGWCSGLHCLQCVGLSRLQGLLRLAGQRSPLNGRTFFCTKPLYQGLLSVSIEVEIAIEGGKGEAKKARQQRTRRETKQPTKARKNTKRQKESQNHPTTQAPTNQPQTKPKTEAKMLKAFEKVAIQKFKIWWSSAH